MNTNRCSRLSIIIAIATTAWALPGCMADAGDADNAMADVAAGDANPTDESEDVAEAQQALLANVTLTQWQTVTSATWSFWAWTNLEFTNTSSSTGWASLQAGAGAPEYIEVPPRTIVTFGRQYWAMPVHITNVSSPSLSVKVW